MKKPLAHILYEELWKKKQKIDAMDNDIKDIRKEEGYKVSMAEFKGMVLTKLQTIDIKVDDLKDQNENRLSKMETRLDNIDLYHAKIPLDKLLNDAGWVENLRANWYLILGLGGLFMSILGAIIDRAMQKILHW